MPNLNTYAQRILILIGLGEITILLLACTHIILTHHPCILILHLIWLLILPYTEDGGIEIYDDRQ